MTFKKMSRLIAALALSFVVLVSIANISCGEESADFVISGDYSSRGFESFKEDGAVVDSNSANINFELRESGDSEIESKLMSLPYANKNSELRDESPKEITEFERLKEILINDTRISEVYENKFSEKCSKGSFIAMLILRMLSEEWPMTLGKLGIELSADNKEKIVEIACAEIVKSVYDELKSVDDVNL